MEKDIQKLAELGLNGHEIAIVLDIGLATVFRKAKKHGIKFKKGRPRGTKEKHKCQTCGVGYSKLVSKSKKFCSRCCYWDSRKGRPILSIEKLKSIDKSYMQSMEYRQKLMKPNADIYQRFRNRVTKLSEITYEKNVNILNPNGYPRTLCGVEGGWQLDHIKSVRECFDSGWTPEQTSCLSNLQLLPWKSNLLKR